MSYKLDPANNSSVYYMYIKNKFKNNYLIKTDTIIIY